MEDLGIHHMIPDNLTEEERRLMVNAWKEELKKRGFVIFHIEEDDSWCFWTAKSLQTENPLIGNFPTKSAAIDAAIDHVIRNLK